MLLGQASMRRENGIRNILPGVCLLGTVLLGQANAQDNTVEVIIGETDSASVSLINTSDAESPAYLFHVLNLRPQTVLFLIDSLDVEQAINPLSVRTFTVQAVTPPSEFRLSTQAGEDVIAQDLSQSAILGTREAITAETEEIQDKSPMIRGYW